MALASLFDDFPVFRYDNESLRRNRLVRPRLYSVLDSLEDEIGHKVGQVFRVLPRLTMELDEYENSEVGKKRKLRSGAVSTYEPKSKVVVSHNDDKFKIILDTSNYQPEEITVKVVNDKLAISAKHEAKEMDVYEFSEMYRSFDLPENIDPNALTSHLSASGQLTVEAPLKALSQSKERTIPIERLIEEPIDGKDKQSTKEPIESKEQQAAGEQMEEPIESKQAAGEPMEEPVESKQAAGVPMEEPIESKQAIGVPLEEPIESKQAIGEPMEEPNESKEQQAAGEPMEEPIESKEQQAAGKPMEEPIESKEQVGGEPMEEQTEGKEQQAAGEQIENPIESLKLAAEDAKTTPTKDNSE